MTLNEFTSWITGDGHYMTSSECMGHDKVWITALAVGCILICIGYMVIAAGWFIIAAKTKPSPLKRSLTTLIQVFTFCGLCGYANRVCGLFWPTQRITVLLLIPLAISTYTFIFNRHGFRALKKAMICSDDVDNRLLALEKFTDMIPNLAWIAQPDGWITWYNQQWYDYTGTTFEQMQGWGWQSVHDPKALPDIVRKWKNCLDKVEAFEMTFRLRRKDCTYRWFITRVKPIFEDGELAHWFGTNTDCHHEHMGTVQASTLMQDLIDRLAFHGETDAK